MNKSNFKYKYVLIFILSLFAFIGGLNYKHWSVTNSLKAKRISIIYPQTKTDIGNRNIRELLRQEFHKQGFEVIFNDFYLDCNRYNEKEEIEHINKYLDLLGGKSTDLILTIGDQAIYSLLSTHHRLLSSIPVVAFNVHFPNEELIEKYDAQKVYVLRDTPDLKRNIDFIQTLYPYKNMEILYNIDLTSLGRKSFDLLARVVDRQNVRFSGSQKTFVQEHDYKHLTEMIEYFNLKPGLLNDTIKDNGLTISLFPFRYIRGAALMVTLEKSKREKKNQAFILDKLDMMAIPMVTALNIPSFSCIREGFGENAKIVGGYMATEEISAKTTVALASRLMKKEKIGMPKIRDLEKEYVLDWKYFSEYGGDISNVPQSVRIINFPFYDRYRKVLYVLAGLFVLSFILVTISLLRTHRRSLIERKNLQMLKEVHKRLSLSMDGGKISLWNIQDGVLEFDDNFAQLVGMQQRRFTKEDLLKYTHLDDAQLLSSYFEMLHHSSGMKVQRIRFCFGKTGSEYQWYELRCSSLKDAQGEIMLAGIMQNVQKLVEHEHQLILAKQIAEKAELKQSFLNNMSHEIRTPLNAIVGFTNLLLGEGADEIEPEEKAAMLEIVNNNNELLLKLVNDVLEISRLDSGNLTFDIKECNITKIVKEIYVTYQTMIQPSLRFHLDLDETVPLVVNIDSFRFTQVISNFLNNANKFTKKGAITLGCEVDKEHQEIRIYVKDTGKGIDEKELMMIFDRFYKTDEFEQGSGLGLSICKVIIERLAGRIDVQSELGKGSCFSVILSLANTI
ncbi:HAMP domain-containing sensor histidine kinase [uncultured Bacteroides sp.]|uniref:sensor histidine kinase n=1 Tax=uncultured Bacteroides sp. TaxID=162156 RepID=UPI0025FF6AED|nr:HAMP domain-containing sensor histidine kinase [uncultured Bacteroides sp.]